MARTQVFSATFDGVTDGNDLASEAGWTKINDIAYTSTIKIGNPTGTAGYLYGWYSIANAGSGSLIVQADADQDKTAQCVRNTGTYSNDQYAKATISGFGIANPSYGAGVIVRGSTDTDDTRDFYALYVCDNTTKSTVLCKVVNGAFTILDSRTSVTWSNGDTIELEVSGTTLTPYKNGVALGYTATDSSLTTGRPGVYLAGLQTSSPLLTLDSLDFGDVTASSTQAPRSMNLFRQRRK